MKKNYFLHKALSLVLVLAMFTCCTACGCGANIDENNSTTESGVNDNTTATDGTNNTTESGTIIGTDNQIIDESTMPTDQITDGTEGIIEDAVDGVMNGVDSITSEVGDMKDNATNNSTTSRHRNN